jgi:DNA adenine methylase
MSSYETNSRPFVKWAGGKRQLLPELLRHLPRKWGAYHEPFVGGGALFWTLANMGPVIMQEAHLSDVNLRLVTAYQAVRNNLEQLIALLRTHDRQYKMGGEDYFYDLRKMERVIPVARAAWFLFFNRTCFNGLWRVNKQDQFNVPHGSYKNPTICDSELLGACSRVLNQGRVSIRWEDFTAVEQRAVKGDLVYFDPPYVPAFKNRKTSNFTAYTKDGFSMQDQTRLRDLALMLKKNGVHVMLSNSHTPEVEELYHRDFDLFEVEARRNVNSKGTGRGVVKEYIIR